MSRRIFLSLLGWVVVWPGLVKWWHCLWRLRVSGAGHTLPVSLPMKGHDGE